MEKICGQHRATIQNYKANFALDQREKLANLYKATSLVLTGPPCNVSPGRYMCIWCGHIYVQVTCSCRVFIHPSLRRDVLWYTNVRLSVRFTCHALTLESLGQFTSNFMELLELIVLRSVYFLVKFQFFIPELWDFIHQIVGDFSYVTL